MYEFLLFCLSGAIVGLLAGALGVGGGGIIIPIVVLILGYTGIEHALLIRIAIATSFATIIFSTLASILSHLSHKSIPWYLLKLILPGVILGVFLGSLLIQYCSSSILQIFFCFFLIYTIHSLLKPQIISKTKNLQTQLPHTHVLLLIGGLVGFISSFIGIAGGSISVPILSKIMGNMHSAISSSSVIGFCIALIGATTSIYTGWNIDSLPQYSLGYIYLPAMLGTAIVSMLTAPLGVKIAYSLSQTRLKQLFALFLTVVLIQFLYTIPPSL